MFSYHLRQSIGNLKKAVFMFIGMSVAISMVAGLFFLFDTVENEAISSSFQRIDDFNIEVDDNHITSQNMESIFEGIDKAINISKLNYEEKTKYIMLSHILDTVKLIKEADNPFGGISVKNLSISLQMALFEESFYQSERFNTYFQIVSGAYPKNQNEIMIDRAFAYKFDLSLNQTTNFTIEVETFETIPFGIDEYITITDYEYYTIPNLTITGYYAPKSGNYEFVGLNFYHGYKYSDDLNETNFDSIVLGNPFIFSYYNFSDVNATHLYENFFGSSSTHFGVLLFYNKEVFNLDNLNSLMRIIQNQKFILARRVPRHVTLEYSFTDEIFEVIEKTEYLRYSIQFINIPIILFAILIGSFTTKNSIKNRTDEFLLLKSKGMDPKTIRNQILIESLINGIVSSLLGILLGTIVFHWFRSWLSELFISYIDISKGSLLIAFSSIRDIMLLGISITILTSISSIRFISKLRIADLLTTMGENEMDINYDENTLFGKNLMESYQSERYTGNNDDKSKEKSQILEIKDVMDTKKKRNRKIIHKKNKNTEIYENQFELKTKRIRKLSPFLIIISLIPCIILILILISELPSAPDGLISFGETFYTILTQIPLSQLILFIFPFFLIFGVIRFITTEYPSRYARLCRKISLIFFPGENGTAYLVGMEMVKRKKFSALILLIGIISGLITFLNIVDNTNNQNQKIVGNLSIGADLKISLTSEQFAGMPNRTNLENSLYSIQNSQNESVIKNVATVFQENSQIYESKNIYYVNFSKYLEVIKEDGKFMPDPSMESKIREAINHDLNETKNYPAAIVSDSFLRLNGLEIGDLIDYRHAYYIPDAEVHVYLNITVEIVQVISLLPGIYSRPLGYDTPGVYGSYFFSKTGSENIAIDISIIDESDQLIHSSYVYHLIDLNQSVDYSNPAIASDVRSEYSNITEIIPTFSYYDQNWADINYRPTRGIMNISGFFWMAYMVLIIIAIQIALGLAVLISASQQENRHFIGILLSRGFGRKGIFKFLFSQIFLIYFLGLFIGILFGVVSGNITMNLLNTVILRGITLPVLINFPEILLIIGSIVTVSLTIFIVSYFFETRHSIDEYLRQF